MKALLKSSAACGNLRFQNWEALTDEQLRHRRRKARQMVAVVVGLMLLVIVMAGISQFYPLAITSIAMFAALDEYLQKVRGITRELRLRGQR